MSKPVDILFIENSVGLSGSTMSLCTLLNYLDSGRIAAHIVLSRPEQDAYLHTHLHRSGELKVITPRRGLKHASIVSRVLQLLGTSRPKLSRVWLSFVAQLDVILVTIPYAWRLHQFAT